MNNTYVIKFHHLYYNQYPGSFVADINLATNYIHPENAKGAIKEKKLDEACKVYQVNFVEMEVK